MTLMKANRAAHRVPFPPDRGDKIRAFNIIRYLSERKRVHLVAFADDPADARGFRTVYTGPAHPYGGGLWPIPGLGIGYSETKIVECFDLFSAIASGKDAGQRRKQGKQRGIPSANDAHNTFGLVLDPRCGTKCIKRLNAGARLVLHPIVQMISGMFQ